MTTLKEQEQEGFKKLSESISSLSMIKLLKEENDEFNEDEYLQDDDIIALDKEEELKNIPFDDNNTEYIKEKPNNNDNNMSTNNNDTFESWKDFKSKNLKNKSETTDTTNEEFNIDSIDTIRQVAAISIPVLIASVVWLFTKSASATKRTKEQVLQLAALKDIQNINDDEYLDIIRNNVLKGKSIDNIITPMLNSLTEEDKVKYDQALAIIKADTEKSLRLQGIV